jgi:UDP-N-acetylglucosamine 4,6-dehydratase
LSSILITGGTGSFGHAFVRHLLASTDCPRRICILSRDEYKQHLMRETLRDDRLRFFLGDVRDVDRLRIAFRGIDTVIHAAALKRIDSCAYSPYEAVQTNILGTWNVIRAALDTGSVTKVIALSSDKASSPLNLYGKTKACLEDLVLHAGAYSGGRGPKFAAVRYGNVSGSRGSVIPFWRQCLADGKPLPIVDANATRFWFTLQGAVELVCRVSNTMRGGELYVPRLPSFSVGDLAAAMVPDGVTPDTIQMPMRDGEKMHESMISADEASMFQAFHDGYVRGASGGEALASGFSYTSDKNVDWLSTNDLRERLKDVQ